MCSSKLLAVAVAMATTDRDWDFVKSWRTYDASSFSATPPLKIASILMRFVTVLVGMHRIRSWKISMIHPTARIHSWSTENFYVCLYFVGMCLWFVLPLC
uniref:Uncharacterized protein n=1 Tax=Aegilops tauschii subsp. strangulata TaxID=200361 RepID=A0A453NBL1_AEGTS